MPHSLYSGRARSYLIKNRIPFEERSTGHESFKAEVLPKSKLPTIPTLVTAEGKVIRDGAAIIEHFEATTGRACQPRGARQQVISALFDVIGTDGLLRPAMHYRWNFPEDNLAFVRYHFLHSQRDVPAREEKTEAMMNRMRHAAMIFGVTEQSQPVVEALYLEYLEALNIHFEHHPYLLGWRPCIGDFGLLAPMYGHLVRDPYPARRMQQRAPAVYRWVERMNREDQDAPELFKAGSGFLANDEVPETMAAAVLIDRWLAERQPDPGAVAVGRLAEALGTADFIVRGEPIAALAQPHRFYLLQPVQEAFTILSGQKQTEVRALLEACGMERLLTAVLSRRITRSDNLEVWE